MDLGNFKIYSIPDGFFRLDGGAMFGRVPKEIWKKTNPPDRKNRIWLALNCLLIKTKKYNILVNTGIGKKYDLKFAQRFGIMKTCDVEVSLKLLGFTPEDIDFVINTHLHLDHCGGNSIFPNAKYIIQKGEWQDALSGNLLTRASYRQECFLPPIEQKRIEFIDGSTELERGISLVVTGGHTKNHQIVRIESEGRGAIYLSDLVPTTSHLNYPSIMGYDLYPRETLERKMEILPKAAENHDILIFEHDPKISMATIKIKDGRPKLDKEVWQ